jgi:endonuclease-8
MTGSWKVGPAATEPAWRRRVELWLDDGRLTALDVPLLSVVATADEAATIGHLGPDLCGPESPDLAAITANMRRAPDEPLAAAMLDQRNAAGWGNLYANEVPFIVGLDPFQPVGTIDGLEHVVAIGAALIRTNAARGPQNTTGRKLATDDHWIYRRRGQPCPLCATRLVGADERDVPWRRVTTWCPQCQPRGERATADVTRARRLLALHPARRALA